MIYTDGVWGEVLNIIISNSSGKPFYEQIASQIRGMIFSGELEEGEALPSMRSLAKDLRISLITTKRAYEDLEQAGFLYTLPGKGCFVAAQDPAIHREEALRKVEEHLQNAIDAARAGGVSAGEVRDTLEVLLDGEYSK